ncbi:endoglucanase [Salmonella enterica subsp. enterica]|uniref:cellulase n=1 Tax=Salmonella enterica I TaxID=59201 RepID=A0A379WKN7_SALET|nr:endoglucanase [Salmonella enterica subsp. enterica]
MFFALAANDRPAFAQLFNWTQNNLAQGSLREHLPAWLWGQKDPDTWSVLDSNSASDGDIWMAWSLLEAGRLWKETRYTEVGTALLKTHRPRRGRECAGAGLNAATWQNRLCRGE